MKKIIKENYMSDVSEVYYKEKILEAGLKMAKSKNTIMPFGDYSHFLAELRKLLNRNKRDIYFEYNFPKAYLMNGLLEYALYTNNKSLVSSVYNIFEKYIDDDGSIGFELDKVDQSAFGLSFINLHNIYGDEKYKIGADEIYEYIKSNIDPVNMLILYRKGQDRQFVDVLGMVVPFLIKYGVTYNDNAALNIAYEQLDYYIKNGLEDHSHFPFHAISLDSKLRLGPSTWGRGVGWYALALGYVLQYTDINNNPKYSIYEDEMDSLYRNAMALRVNGYWGQFISGSKNDKIDSSTTTMLIYSFSLAGKNVYKNQDLVDLFSSYTNLDGYLDFTSGDTYSVNRYAVTHGKSELSQGILLSLFSLN